MTWFSVLAACAPGLLAEGVADDHVEDDECVAPLDGPRPTGPLTGMLVFLSAGHGRLVQRTASGAFLTWDWQRDARYGMREDVWTAEFSDFDLAPALEKLGASVLTLRERDHNPVRALVDDGGPGFSFEGGLLRETDLLAYEGSSSVITVGGSATWTLTAPADGRYLVQTRWVAAEDREPDARYTITRGDDQLVKFVDQRRHGGIWWPLGEVDLVAGEQVTVTLEGIYGALSADAVKIGGGMASPGPGLAEAPAWEVAPIHRWPEPGGPERLLHLEDGGLISDIRFRAQWASWVAAQDRDVAYLSIHTNAGRGHGTSVFVGYESRPRLDPSVDGERLAREVHRAIDERKRDWAWENRHLERGDFSETSPKWNANPATLIEAGFHDNPRDAKRLLDARFRHDLAAAIADGVVRFRQREGR
jgi:N-acetylmuramoyl-L-alanine amidase